MIKWLIYIKKYSIIKRVYFKEVSHLDEKKDILTPEVESEESVVSDTDTSTNELDNIGSFSDELLETGALEELESYETESQPVKTKKRLF